MKVMMRKELLGRMFRTAAMIMIISMLAGACSKNNGPEKPEDNTGQTTGPGGNGSGDQGNSGNEGGSGDEGGNEGGTSGGDHGGSGDSGEQGGSGDSGDQGGSGGSGGSGGGGNSEYWKELQEAMDKKFDEAEKARKAELADLDAQLEALKKARDTEEDRLELEEKILAVTEAQAKLANAQAERNVRMYNAATGQWEWIADQKAVQSAKDQLKNAQDALDKFRKDQEYDAAVAAIKAQQDAVNARYDELRLTRRMSIPP